MAKMTVYHGGYTPIEIRRSVLEKHKGFWKWILLLTAGTERNMHMIL